MGKSIDLTGQKFGRLIVLEKSNKLHNKTTWLCKCDCGNYKKATTSDLKSNKIKSCGCLLKERAIVFCKNKSKHNLTGTRIYRIWNSMKQRCYYKNGRNYKNYGAKGITVYKEWKNDFLNFYNWSINNGYKDNLTIDRINVNGNYEPNNCRWVSMKEQENNRTNNRIYIYGNKKYTISQLSNKINIPYNTLLWRINNNWSENELSLKANYNNKKIRGGK